MPAAAPAQSLGQALQKPELPADLVITLRLQVLLQSELSSGKESALMYMDSGLKP